MKYSNDKLAKLRQEYIFLGITESDMLADPFEQFNQWFHLAEQARTEGKAIFCSTG